MEGMDNRKEKNIVGMSAEVVHPFVHQHLRIVAVVLFADNDVIAPTERWNLFGDNDEPATVFPLFGVGSYHLPYFGKRTDNLEPIGEHPYDVDSKQNDWQ